MLQAVQVESMAFQFDFGRTLVLIQAGAATSLIGLDAIGPLDKAPAR